MGNRPITACDHRCTFKKENGQDGAVYIYQSVEVGEETTRETTKFILLLQE